MPAQVASPPAMSGSRRVPDLDSYDVDGFDDPFGSPTPQPDENTSKKRKQDDSLGIDEEVSVAKRARVPTVKLDESAYVDIPRSLSGGDTGRVVG